jgi:hypothetical protein
METVITKIVNKAYKSFLYLPEIYRPSKHTLKHHAEVVLQSELYDKGIQFEERHIPWLAGIVYDLYVEEV